MIPRLLLASSAIVAFPLGLWLAQQQGTMELNATENSPDGRTNGGNVLQIEQEDSRILATSYVIYKVGKSEQLSSCQLF